MRLWRDAAVASMRLVSARPELWLPGGLAWVVTVGWIPFVVAVASPPSVTELTFLGAGFVVSGAWPWNAMLMAVTAMALVLVAFVLAAVANAYLIRQLSRPDAPGSSARGLLAVNAVVALPLAVAALAVLLALAGVAPREFNAPDATGGPILRTIARLAPYLVLFCMTAAVGATLASVAARLRGGTMDRLRATPAVAARTGPAVHAIVAFLGQVAFLVLVAMLLRILWAPIGAQLVIGGEIDLASGLLLVGFVAIWLCIVLAGGALHAWSAATWSRLIAAGSPRGAIPEGPESTWKR